MSRKGRRGRKSVIDPLHVVDRQQLHVYGVIQGFVRKMI